MSGPSWYCNDDEVAALVPDCCSQSQVGEEPKQQAQCSWVLMSLQCAVHEEKKTYVGVCVCVCARFPLPDWLWTLWIHSTQDCRRSSELQTISPLSCCRTPNTCWQCILWLILVTSLSMYISYDTMCPSTWTVSLRKTLVLLLVLGQLWAVCWRTVTVWSPDLSAADVF